MQASLLETHALTSAIHDNTQCSGAPTYGNTLFACNAGYLDLRDTVMIATDMCGFHAV